MRTAEIREKFLSFFEGKGHLRLPSFSLIPEDDPSLLFTSAGMAPLKPYFLGAKPIFGGREWRRVTTCQECLRVGDIENVGRTSRHNTYFEMLGNFSFGDYFKKEAILWAWEFLTEHLKLDPGRLWVTVFEDDDEAYEIWRDLVGVPEERIGRFGEDENYWPGGAITHGPNGPSGPCSEIFYDRGPAYGTPDETGPNTGSGDRFVEIWNLVFTQYDRQGPIPGPGILKPLPQKNIDTGMGLYRVAAILQDVEDFYRTDTFFPIIQEVARMSGRPYEGKTSVSHRVIADHVRAVVAALSDGATFSNTGRGYVIRRLLRRALRHGYLLGLSDPFLHRLAPWWPSSSGTSTRRCGRTCPRWRSRSARRRSASWRPWRGPQAPGRPPLRPQARGGPSREGGLQALRHLRLPPGPHRGDRRGKGLWRGHGGLSEGHGGAAKPLPGRHGL